MNRPRNATLSASLAKRWRALSVFLLTGFSALTSTGTLADVVQVQFWTMQLSPFHDAYIRGVIRDFEKQHPDIRVKWVDVPWSEMEKKTLTAVAAATPRRPAPDVVNLNPQFASKLAEFGALADPEKFLSAAEIRAYLPAAWKANRLDGKTFALPWYLTTSVLLYNKPLLRQAGVEAPKTFEGLLPAAQKVRAATGRYAYFPALDGSTPLETLVSMGAPILSVNGCRAGFIDERGERVFAFHQRLYQDGLVPKNVVTEGHRKAVEMFLAGQVAMVSTGMQFLQFIKTNNPAFYADVGVTLQIGSSDTPPNIAAMNVAVLEQSPNKLAAFRFATFLTNAANQTEFARRVPILPSSTKSYEDPFFTKPSGDRLLDEARALSVEQVKRGEVLVPPMRNYNKFRSDYARNLQAVMLNRKTTRQALTEIDATWSALLPCAKKLANRGVATTEVANNRVVDGSTAKKVP
ncbi:MAG: sugar ABC transporter substrate-binding protein [Aeromicrobium sp.]|nr:sugar ABC transporter substrate-binding protein [Burkholderiales bacterium]